MTIQTLPWTQWISQWTAYAQQIWELAQERRQPLLASWSTPITFPPAGLVRIFSQSSLLTPRYYWSSPGDAHTLVGVGSAYSCTGRGESRFQQLGLGIRSVESALHATHPSFVRWLGGFSFEAGHRRAPWADWADIVLTIPIFLFEQKGLSTQFTVSRWLHPDDDWSTIHHEITEQFYGLLSSLDADVPVEADCDGNDAGTSSQRDTVAEHEWKASVQRTSADIRNGVYEKVVLARRQSYDSTTPFSIHQAIHRLQMAYGDSFIYGVYQNDQCFVGASPERLVRAKDGQVSIDCLAGTMRRGLTLAEDESVGQELLMSPKNREEHAVVRRWLQSQVEDMVREFTAPSIPVLKKLKNVQHLYSPIGAKLAPGYHLLDVAARLHPTPAVAGNPRARAMDVIRNRENMDRGWYAGAVGWKGVLGDGEFTVALRCALVAGCQAHLFAGCGIMGDSDPEQEWLETKLKLRPMEMALGCQPEGEC